MLKVEYFLAIFLKLGNVLNKGLRKPLHGKIHFAVG